MTINSTYESNGVSIVDGDKMKFDYPGTYNIQFSTVFTKSNANSGIADVWFARNGQYITASNTSFSIAGQSDQISSWNFITSLNSNDYIQLYWSSNDTNISILATGTQSTPDRPSVPSVILTAQQVMYTQVGATGSNGTSGTSGTSGVSGTSGTSGSSYYVVRSFTQSVGSNSTGETQLLKLTIPANTFNPTDKISFFAMFSKTGTASNTTHRIKISTSSSMPTGASSQVAQYASTNTYLFTKISRELIVSDGNIKSFPSVSSSLNDVGISTSAMSSIAFDVTQTQYLYVSATPTSTTTDVTYLEAFEVKNI